MVVEEQAIAAESWWGEYPAEEWSDAVVASMKLGGVERLYFVSGSELAFWQESIAKAHDRGRAAPQLITMIHEGVALNAALGEAMVTGQPAASAAHVDVGTFNYGAALHTAWRGSYPVLITSGAGPRAFGGSMPGARDNAVQWLQEPRDQGEILRQYTKLDHRLEHQDNPGLMVSRLLQVAMSEPKGPVFLTVPRESARLPMGGAARFPTRDQLGVSRPAWPDPADARRIAQWLIEAENPCICTGQSGRDPESVAELVRLAELLALPVSEGAWFDRLGFPTTHPLYGTGPALRDADVILVMQTPVPYLPPEGSPRPDAKIAWVDPDPVQSRYKTMEFRADLWLPVTAAAAARAIHDAAEKLLNTSDLNRIEQRRARLAQRKQEMAAAAEAQAQAAGKRRPLHPRWVAYQLSQILEPDAMLLDDALSNSGHIRPYHRRAQAGTYFKAGSSAGGWGVGAAFGAKLARPNQDVVLASGDGFFLFSEPVAALWSAAHYKAPFLSVVFVNRSYSTGTAGVTRSYPDGVVAQTGNYEGGVFDPPPDFARLAESANCYGETISEPEEVGPALRRGLEQVRKGTPAVIAAYLPTVVEEEQLARRG